MKNKLETANDVYVAQTELSVTELEKELKRIEERGYEVVSVSQLHDSYVITAVEKGKGE